MFYRANVSVVGLLVLSGCDLGTTYEQAGPMYYETYIRDPAYRVQASVSAMPLTTVASMPTEGTATYDGGFIGKIGGCGFDLGCNNSNAVYGRSSLSADFQTQEISASIARLVIEYDEVDEYGLHTIGDIRSTIGTTAAGAISGNTFSGVVMSTGNYYGNNDYLIKGTLGGYFRGDSATAVSGAFSGSIAKLTGGYPLGGYESFTGQVSAKAQP